MFLVGQLGGNTRIEIFVSKSKPDVQRSRFSPVPIVLGFPAMFLAVPPLVILSPTVFSFGIQIVPPLLSLMAPLAIVLDRRIQFRFGPFDGMLTL